MSFEDVLVRCITKWRDQGIALSPPVDEIDVRRVWDGFGKKVSEDVVHLYSTLGGFAEYEMDDEFFWSLWPWDLVCRQNTERRGEAVTFCDHSIELVTWELRFEDAQRSSVWRAETLLGDAVMTAPSLESFFQLYLEAPWQLLDAWNPSDRDPNKLRGNKRGAPIAGKTHPLWDPALDG
jgi:hypothetical protein